MSKSILIIDTPESCIECRFFVNRLCGNGRCVLNKDNANIVTDKGKPDWCPLKEVPFKKLWNKYHNDYERGCVDGFNDCIDEILKERDENETD